MVGDPEAAPAGDPAPPVGDVSLASLAAFQNRAARSRDAPTQSAAIAISRMRSVYREGDPPEE